MDKFLVNMAVIKVNWDKSQGDILDNYIPLIAHALATSTDDIISIEEFKKRFLLIAEFNIPTGAIITLLKRAQRKYGYIEKQPGGLYKINQDRIKYSNFSVIRDAEQRKYNQLKSAFSIYCKNTFNIDLDEKEVDQYFFEVLFEIAPKLFSNISDIDSVEIPPSEQRKFMVCRFISHANQKDNTSFEAIVSFIRGAMLTETFYYSHPSCVQNKMRRVQVFFDTGFLLHALGYSDKAFVTPCIELINMLRGMSVKLKYFRQTYNEVHKILFAAASKLNKYGRHNLIRPGDVFDYFTRNKYSASDIELELAKLEGNLKALGITVEENPAYIEAYSINEIALSENISIEIQHQSEEARNHDIDCLAAIHRMRLGKPQDYLESCVAIFITPNSSLARTSTNFFNKEYGVSNVPVCMADQVFTTLIWLKAVKKAPDLPKDRLVATCYAAMLPSENLWTEYVKEAERLKKNGTIQEEDYAVLIHSLEARNRLMELTFGKDDIVYGTLEQVLESAKAKYISEVNKELDGVKLKSRNQELKVKNVATKVSRCVKQTVLYATIFIWGFLLLYGLVKTSPNDLILSKIFSIDSWLFLLLVAITLVNLILGYRLKDICDKLADAAANFVNDTILKIFLA